MRRNRKSFGFSELKEVEMDGLEPTTPALQKSSKSRRKRPLHRCYWVKNEVCELLVSLALFSGDYQGLANQTSRHTS